MGRFRIGTWAIALGLLLAASTSPAVVFVTPTGAGDLSGSSWDNAFPGLAGAIGANPGEELWVTGGVHAGTAGMFTSGWNGTEVYGGFAGGETQRSQRDPDLNTTVLDAGNANTALFIQDASNVVVDGISIINGSSGGSGGGIFVFAISVAMDNVTINDCVISQNSAAALGGGIVVLPQAGSITNLTISNTEISFNASGNSGAGLALLGGAGSNQVTIDGCVFDTNGASFSGGGVYDQSFTDTVVVNNTVFRGNANGDPSQFGGAFETFSGASFTNCVFDGNSAGNQGGVIAQWAGASTMTNVTMANNLAGANVGGILLLGGTINLINCISWNNVAGGIEHVNFSGTRSNFSVDFSLMELDSTATGPTDWQLSHGANVTVGSDPLFAGAGSLDIQETSPAVDAGTTAGAPSTDIDGTARDASPDIGAYEFVVFVPPVTPEGLPVASWPALAALVLAGAFAARRQRKA